MEVVLIVKAIGHTMGPLGRASALTLKLVCLWALILPEGYLGRKGCLHLFLIVSWQEGSLLGHCDVGTRALGRLGPATSQESCFSGPRLQKKHLQQEKECLMSKLVEAEMDGAAAAKQVMALKDTIGKLKTVGGAIGWVGVGWG